MEMPVLGLYKEGGRRYRSLFSHCVVKLELLIVIMQAGRQWQQDYRKQARNHLTNYLILLINTVLQSVLVYFFLILGLSFAHLKLLSH